MHKTHSRAARNRLAGETSPYLLQHADNRERVEQEILPHLRTMLPKAEILLTPLSLTSGVHMGPGAWSLAFAQED